MGLVPPFGGTNVVDGTIFWYIWATQKVMVNGVYPERWCSEALLNESTVNGKCNIRNYTPSCNKQILWYISCFFAL